MNEALTIIGLSGGIATGKSTCTKIFQELGSEYIEVFDADACVRQLYGREKIVKKLISHFGADADDGQGGINKSWLRRRAFSEPESKAYLESIFHPLVRKECLALLGKAIRSPVSRLFVADIPLLFESGFDFGQSTNLLVATSRETQIERLKNRNAWGDKTVEAVLASQMPIDAKLSLADLVFWNEGPVEILRNQCRRFLRSLS